MIDQTTRSEYLKKFAGAGTAGKRKAQALAAALTFANSRLSSTGSATYFWAFIAAALAGYLVLQQKTDTHFESIYVVTFLGFVFSLAWYCVNRGSKSWQRQPVSCGMPVSLSPHCSMFGRAMR